MTEKVYRSGTSFVNMRIDGAEQLGISLALDDLLETGYLSSPT